MIYRYETMGTMFLALIGLGIVVYAQWKINRTYQTYKKVKLKQTLAGCEIARLILDHHGLSDIHIVETKGFLTDHYDPTRRVIHLSSDIFHGETVASASVAAHECGHAIQDKDGYTMLKIRSILVPFVNLVTNLGYLISIFSILIGIMGYLKIGIMIVLVSILFQLVTLPVEFDASKRALNTLKKQKIVNQKEAEQSKLVLNAAALTYVASFISSIVNLIRLVLLARDRNR